MALEAAEYSAGQLFRWCKVRHSLFTYIPLTSLHACELSVQCYHNQTDIHIKQETCLMLNTGGLLKRRVKPRLATGKNGESFDCICFTNQPSRKIRLLDKGEHFPGHVTRQKLCPSEMRTGGKRPARHQSLLWGPFCHPREPNNTCR